MIKAPVADTYLAHLGGLGKLSQEEAYRWTERLGILCGNGSPSALDLSIAKKDIEEHRKEQLWESMKGA